jgi:hypothetical protein
VGVEASAVAVEFLEGFWIKNRTWWSEAEASLVEAENALSSAVGDREIMGDEEDGEISISLDSFEQFVDRFFSDDIKPYRWFVEEENVGITKECPRDEDFLELTARENAEALGEDMVFDMATFMRFR